MSLRFVSYLLVALMAWKAVNAELSEEWTISDPLFDFSSLNFSFRYQVSDQIERNQIVYSFYDSDKCGDGGKELQFLGFPYLQSGMVLSSPSTSGSKEVQVNVQLDQDTIMDSPIFRQIEYAKDANIAFCMKLALYNTDFKSPQAVEVTFLETAVDFQVTLQDGVFIHLPEEIVIRLLSAEEGTGGGRSRGSLRGQSM